MAKKVKNKFDIVGAEWIYSQMCKRFLSVSQVATGTNTTNTQVYQWLSAYRTPSKAAKAGLYYYFMYGWKEGKAKKKGA